METENILMGQKQLQRWHLNKMVEGRKITPEGSRFRAWGRAIVISY
jgi:hypothetical protein